jgi:hypothetical protein
MEKLRMTSAAKKQILAHTHWVSLLNAGKNGTSSASGYLMSALLLLIVAVLLWPLAMLFCLPCAAQSKQFKRDMREMLYGATRRPQPSTNYLTSYLEKRRALMTAHCPLPPVLQNIVAGYAELSYDDRVQVLQDAPAGRQALSPSDAMSVYCCGVRINQCCFRPT